MTEELGTLQPPPTTRIAVQKACVVGWRRTILRSSATLPTSSVIAR